MLNDLRYAFRLLLKSPAFTIVAVLTLALGIAASTAIFSVVDAVLLHPLPYPQSEQLVSLAQTDRSTGESSEDAAPANYLDWAGQNTVFSAMAASRGWQANLAGTGEPERLRTTMASSQFFTLFGVQPILGRTFGTEDAKPGNANVAVLSYPLWSRRYGADRGIIGRDIILDGEKFNVIGVMPASFSPDDYGELWVPSPWDVPTHQLAPNDNPRAFRGRSYLDIWGRLKPGVTLQQARTEMSTIGLRLEKQYPDDDQNTGVAVVPLHEELVGSVRPMLLMLLGAVVFVLLIACANVANLLLARAASRSREIAIRTALGAPRSRLIRQLLTESTLLALLGGALGVLLTLWALPLLLSLAPREIGDFKGIGLNREVLAFSLLASLATGILFGLVPAFFASRIQPNESLREGERGSSLGKNFTRSSLIVAEITFSLVLLVGAGLMMKSFLRLTSVDPGFNPEESARFQHRPARFGRAGTAGAILSASRRAAADVARRALGRRGQPPPAGGRKQLALLRCAGSDQGSQRRYPHQHTGLFPGDGHPAFAGPDLHGARHEHVAAGRGH